MLNALKPWSWIIGLLVCLGLSGLANVAMAQSAVEPGLQVLIPSSPTPTPTPTNARPTVHCYRTPIAGPMPLDVHFSADAHDPDGVIAQYSWDFGDSGQGNFVEYPALQTISVTAEHTYNLAGNYQATFEVRDDRGAIVPKYASVAVWTWSPTPTATSAATATPTATSTPWAMQVVDNSDPGFTVNGTWSTGSSAGDKYEANYRYANTSAGSTAYAQWQTSLPHAGIWQVAVWYPQAANRTTSASYEVSLPSGTQQWVLNQQTNGGLWNVLGNYVFPAGSAQVRLLAKSTQAGYAMADAVRWQYIGDQSEYIVDNTDTGFSLTGAWVTVGMGGSYGGTCAYTGSGTGDMIAQWHFQPDLCGFYAVDVWYSAGTDRATNVVYTATDGAQTRTSAAVNQQLNGSQWDQVQYIYLPSHSSVTVTLTNAASGGYIMADAVRLRYFTPSAAAVVDNLTPNAFFPTGVWTTGTSLAGKYGADYRYNAAGTGADFVLYRPFLNTPGFYEVSVWYPASSGNAPDAPFIVGSAVGQDLVLIDQRSQGGQWVVLGHYFLPAGTQGFVKLSDAASSGNVIADAVRMTYVAAPLEDNVVDNSDSAFGVTGSWSTSTNAAMYKGTGRATAANGTGDTASWPAPAPKHYLCSVYYAPGANRATDAPYRIDATTPLNYTVNQQIGYLRWIVLNPAQLDHMVLGIDLLDSAVSHTGYVIADAVRFTLIDPE